MKRRRYLATSAAFVSLFSGCASSVKDVRESAEDKCGWLNKDRRRPCPVVTHSPKKPTIGQSVVFDASRTRSPPHDFTGDSLFYFWKVGSNTRVSMPPDGIYVAEGPKYTHRFETSGKHIIELFTTHSGNIIYSNEHFPNVGVGFEYPDEVARKTVAVEVTDLREEEINVTNNDVNISLSSNKQSVSLEETAVLNFSLTNLVGGDMINAQLILEIPTGLSVRGSSFDQGGGQYSSTYVLKPGETISERINIAATNTGPYLVTGYVVYDTGNGTPQRTETSEIQLRFYS